MLGSVMALFSVIVGLSQDADRAKWQNIWHRWGEESSLPDDTSGAMGIAICIALPTHL
jgi:hypothetical protein